MIGNSIKSDYDRSVVRASFYEMYGQLHSFREFSIDYACLNNRIAVKYALPIKHGREMAYVGDQVREQFIIYPSNALLVLGLLCSDDSGLYIEGVYELKTGKLLSHKNWKIFENHNPKFLGESLEYFVGYIHKGEYHSLFSRDSDDKIHKLEYQPIFSDYKSKMTVLRIEGTEFIKVERVAMTDVVAVDSISFKRISDFYYPILSTDYGSFRCTVDEYCKNKVRVGTKLVIDMDYEGKYHLRKIRPNDGPDPLPVCNVCGQRLVLVKGRLYHFGVCKIDENRIRAELGKILTTDLTVWNNFPYKEKSIIFNHLIGMKTYQLDCEQVHYLDEMIKHKLRGSFIPLEFSFDGMTNCKKRMLYNRIILIYRILFKR